MPMTEEEIQRSEREWKAFSDQMSKNVKIMEENDRRAAKAGKLVGRYIRESAADSYAYYLITKENKNTVRIEVITGIGDDWTIPYWGREATIDKRYAMKNLQFRDFCSGLFKEKK
jgi:hypothetical protein